MTNQEIERLIERHEKKERAGISAVPILGWALSSGTAIFMLVSGEFGFFGPIAAALSALSLYVTFDAAKQWKAYQLQRARALWERLGHSQNFGQGLAVSTRLLGTEVQKIYDGEPSGELFPLPQAIRLIDTHHRQQQRLALVENRLCELRQLQESLADKMAQLQQLGEDYPQGARNLEQINGDLAALGAVHGQIRGSCTRLEALVIGVQKAAQGRELRRELEGLSARIAPASAAVEPAFEAQSLEEIERQIGREIETYLQLERETEAHLQ